jgi:hypothetical protein
LQAAAESIQQSSPILTLEQVYDAITYYLAHRGGIDAYLQPMRIILPKLQTLLADGFMGDVATAFAQ